MSYAEDFAKAIKAAKPDGTRAVSFSMKAPFALNVNYGSNQTQTYDFLSRVMISVVRTSGYAEAGIAMTTTPFRDIDREVLEAMHKTLIELGGKPPALPDIGPRADAKINKTGLKAS